MSESNAIAGADPELARPSPSAENVRPETSGEETLDPGTVPQLHEVDIPQALKQAIERHRDRYPEVRSASIPALWEVQRHYGWCTPEGIRQAAAVLGLTPGFLESVASFYDMLKLQPVGTHKVMVCTNISCWLRGGDELMGAFCAAAGTGPHGGDSPEGDVHVEHFECLGACDIAPMASIDYRYYGPLEPGDAQRVVSQLRAGEEVLPGKLLVDRPMAGGSDVPDDPRVADVDGDSSGGTRDVGDSNPAADDQPPGRTGVEDEDSDGTDIGADGGPDAGGPHSEEGSGGAG